MRPAVFRLVVLLLIGHIFLIECRRALRRNQRHLELQTTTDPDDEDDEEFSDDDDRVYKNPRNSPNTHCPRDEDLAAFMGQKCLRKCFSDEDCKSKRKRCLCDGHCGMSCVKPDRECEELASPTLGQVTLRGLLFGDKANYTCELGYTLVGPKQRTCQADGTWSGVAPMCKQNGFCGIPPVMGNARHNASPEQSAFNVDVSIQYKCSNGFVTTGFPVAKCLVVDDTISWFGPDINCEPKSCGTPTDITNGWHTDDCTTFGCRTVYRCNDGYDMVGRAEKTCQADGSWSPKELPSCVPVQCPTPENPLYGSVIFTSTSYNSVVSYNCKYGYMLIGDSTRKCAVDRRWSGSTPKCKEINCGPVSPIYNGWMENTDSGTGLGASIIFRCEEGMRMVGNSSTVCENNGEWRYPTPLCLAPCILPKVDRGRVLLANQSLPNSSLEATAVAHGSNVTLICENRFEPSNASTLMYCNNGTWSYIPKCQPARCKYLPKAPENGIVIAPKMDHGARARYQCFDGYTIQGNRTTDCKYGNWTSEVPICVEKYCPYPGTIDNGKVLLVGSMGLYDYRPYVRKVTNDRQILYECDKGYVLENGPVGATCIDGRWSPNKLPKCNLAKHPQVRLTRSVDEQYFPNTTVLENNTLARFRRALSGQNSQVMRTKQTSGKEGKEKSTGIGSGRSRNRNFDDDDVDLKDYDDEQSRTDNTTKTEQGGKKRRKKICEEIPPQPYMHIEVVKAGKNPNITNSHGSIVRVICANGYRLNIGTNNTAKCGKGRWKPDRPECIQIPCTIERHPHGFYNRFTLEKIRPEDSVVTDETEFMNGDSINFTCKPGFIIKGPSAFTCILGEWDVSLLPDCTPAPCELPVITNGLYLSGYRAGLTIANGSSINYQCDHEFIKITTTPVECYRGELLPIKPACRRDPTLYVISGDLWPKENSTDHGTLDYLTGLRGSCGPPVRVQGTLIFSDGEQLSNTEKRYNPLHSFPDGTEVTFRCVDSIFGDKQTWKIICYNKKWIGRALNCENDSRSASNILGKSNNTCLYRNTEPNVATFHGDQRITEPLVEFPSGTLLIFRCVDIGKYAMEGSNSRMCINGEWDGEKPTCFGLNQENAYALEKPPTILFRHEQGPIAQSNDGKLIVYPGTVLHMECLWLRRFGTPKWNVSHTYRKYPDGWTTDPGRDNQLEYRLSIYHASYDDSGLFTCITPTRHEHSVEIVVKAVHCPEIPNKKGLFPSAEDTKMNAEIQFSCANGNSLNGAEFVTCLPSGNWSARIPTCEVIQCPDLRNLTDPNLRASVFNRFVGGQVLFSCVQGYGLKGPSLSICQHDGEWQKPFPRCSELHCEWSGFLRNGYALSQRKTYKPGEIVRFYCQSKYILDGQAELTCEENGHWSSPIPSCIEACSYPGTVIRGTMSSVKFYYSIGETITFSCDEGLVIRGSATIQCLENGNWSRQLPTCIPAHVAKNATFAKQ